MDHNIDDSIIYDHIHFLQNIYFLLERHKHNIVIQL